RGAHGSRCVRPRFHCRATRGNPRSFGADPCALAARAVPSGRCFRDALPRTPVAGETGGEVLARVSTNLPTSVGRGLADEAPAGARDGLSVGRNRCFSVAFAQSGRATATGEVPQRSEERRVGKGGRCRVSWFQ